MGIWTFTKTILRETLKEVFPRYPFHLMGMKTDELTFKAVFILKAKRTPTPILLSTEEILADDKYLLGLSPKDRRKLVDQYLVELKQPSAYIEEFPIVPNGNNEFIFKIFLIDEQTIVCGSACYFMHEAEEVLTKLNRKDVMRLAMAYYQEKFTPSLNGICSENEESHRRLLS